MCFQNNLYSNTGANNVEDFGLISLMYHRFEENKYPSTNIRNEIFIEQLKLIKEEKIEFITFDKFEEITKYFTPTIDNGSCTYQLPTVYDIVVNSG